MQTDPLMSPHTKPTLSNEGKTNRLQRMTLYEVRCLTDESLGKYWQYVLSIMVRWLWKNWSLSYKQNLSVKLCYAHFRVLLLVEILEQPIRLLKKEHSIFFCLQYLYRIGPRYITSKCNLKCMADLLFNWFRFSCFGELKL